MTIEALSVELGQRLESCGFFMTTAESCTGGLIAGAVTDIAGSSGWFAQGVVTYSNQAKHDLLGVSEHVFAQHGAVSEACVRAMAAGALERSGADVALSVSGIAGPGGATADKPVGTVWIGWAFRHPVQCDKDASQFNPTPDVIIDAEVFTFPGDRRFVRRQAVFQGLRGTISRINNIENAGLLKQ